MALIYIFLITIRWSIFSLDLFSIHISSAYSYILLFLTELFVFLLICKNSLCILDSDASFIICAII